MKRICVKDIRLLYVLNEVEGLLGCVKPACRRYCVTEARFWRWWLYRTRKVDIAGYHALRKENVRLRRQIRNQQRPIFN